MRQTVIGLSGHIDHGKTSLIKSLTGKDTDILIDEISRGMTIDIGFAFYNDFITIIDVPGHEKFIKNMLTGVSSIDIAVLVVAADDGIMPQTREHFDILKLLDIKNGIIAVTKIDLVEPEWIEMIETDIRDFVSNSFFEGSDIIRISSKENIGIDSLRLKIDEIATSLQRKSNTGVFRLWADRVFSKKGFGTVITGTVCSGKINVGDNIDILPYKITSKVRGLHTHGNAVESVSAGDRAAINFQNLDRNIISRGTQVSSVGCMEQSKDIVVNFRVLDSYKKSVSNNQRLRFYCGTIELMCRVLFSSRKKLEPGDNCIALLRLEKEVSLFKDDKFIIRSYSPMITIGGGSIIDPSVKGKWSKIKIFMDTYKQAYGIKNFIDNPFDIIYKSNELMYKFGIDNIEIDRLLKDIDIVRINKSNNDWILSQNSLLRFENKIVSSMEDYFKSNNIVSGLNITQIKNLVEFDELIVKSLLGSLINKNKVSYKNHLYTISGHSPALDNRLDPIKDKIIKIVKIDSFMVPSVKEVNEEISVKNNDFNKIIHFLETQEEMFQLDNTFLMHKSVYNKIKETILEYFKSNKTISVPQFKDIFNISRKYAVPILEFLDKQKITIRNGNDRELYQ